jgi:hypothetical protein
MSETTGSGAAPRLTITCPMLRCQSPNDPYTERCRRCGVPLTRWLRLRVHAARLFNEGLAAARGGEPAAARDRFAAVVHWHPHDIEARNALALAAYEAGDVPEAARQWQTVLAQSPRDAMARRGLAGCPAPDAAEE